MRSPKATPKLPRALRKKPDSSQHGDLSRALVAAGLAQLEVRGADAISLREAARAAGVSPMAAYHHFRDKQALCAAIAAAGFAEFVAQQERAVASAPTTFDALLALGRCYVASARAHPELFRLMVGRGLVSVEHVDLRAEVARAFEVARAAVARHRPELDERRTRAIAASGWALAHGVAALIVDDIVTPRALGVASAEQLVELLLRVHWEGGDARARGGGR